ncbi:hypothetical protein GGS23DRAFT_570485 [Durotheca rogersii]|uniref:uncharacterized protein n=1 Tax=Durotheca rogersii TaxID=419775 RepID=UPI0022203D44|nr:uncharacterized protein GGS23DRAFT_570485 [Durotheca rogersii]KAI5862498.1 hypothetical protein GGS23DRAFT_570485 [Durotheca rogersii]
MNNTDLYLSNGTCFFGPGQVADDNYIPCGNAALSGPQSCCYAGDYCLSSTACWNELYVVTYIAGCTDSTFSSAKCTNKFDYPGQQYVAMARCEGDQVDIWSGCSHHPEWIEILKEPDCACNASQALIRNSNGESTLDNIGSLPPTPGGTISFNPTAIPTRRATSSSSIYVSATQTSTPAATTDFPPDDSSSRGLSTGAKAGIGVGVGVGVPLVAALAFVAFFLRRRNRKAAQEPPAAPEVSAAPPPRDGDTGAAAARVEPGSSPDSLKENTVTPDPPEPSPTGFVYKPELSGNPTLKSELAGDEPPSSLASSSWNSGTLESHQVSELSGLNAIPKSRKSF